MTPITTSTQIEAILALVAEAERLGVPVALWGSIPCTGGSQWQHVNIAKFGFTEKLQSHWRAFRRLWLAFEKIARRVLRAGGLVNTEWPNGCAYWGDRRVRRFLDKEQFSKAIVAACMHGMRPQRVHRQEMANQLELSCICRGD